MSFLTDSLRYERIDSGTPMRAECCLEIERYALNVGTASSTVDRLRYERYDPAESRRSEYHLSVWRHTPNGNTVPFITYDL